MKIFVFGDSFSEPYGTPQFRNSHWSNQLKLVLECEIVMGAKVGSTNENILHQLIRHFGDITKDDADKMYGNQLAKEYIPEHILKDKKPNNNNSNADT